MQPRFEQFRTSILAQRLRPFLAPHVSGGHNMRAWEDSACLGPQPTPTLVTGWRNAGGRELQLFLGVLGRVRSGIKSCAHRISGRLKKPDSPDERRAKAKTL